MVTGWPARSRALALARALALEALGVLEWPRSGYLIEKENLFDLLEVTQL